MSRKIDYLDMEVIQELAKSSQKVQDLIKEKNKEVYEIKQSQKTKFKEFDPVPKPKGDVRINKEYSKETMSNEVLENKIQTTKDIYNSKIKEALEERAFEEDRENLYPMIDAMDKNDVSTLIENGRCSFENKTQEKEQMLEEKLKLDMDSLNEKYNDHPIYLDFEKNLEDLDMKTSPNDDFE